MLRPAGSVIGGSAETSVMVPLSAKVMLSAPGMALAFSIASRREPGPLSAVLVTVKLAARAAGGCPTSRPSSRARRVRRCTVRPLIARLPGRLRRAPQGRESLLLMLGLLSERTHSPRSCLIVNRPSGGISGQHSSKPTVPIWAAGFRQTSYTCDAARTIMLTRRLIQHQSATIVGHGHCQVTSRARLPRGGYRRLFDRRTRNARSGHHHKRAEFRTLGSVA